MSKNRMILLVILTMFFTVNIHASPLTNLTPETVDVPIIMYHTLSKNKGLLGDWTITPEEFEKDLVYLKESGFEPVFMEDLINYVYYGSLLPEKPIVLTFDDSDSSCHRYLMPLLEKHGMKAVLSVIGNPTDLYSSLDRKDLTYYPHVTWDQINEILATGLVEIASHSYDMHNGMGARKKSGESYEDYKVRMSTDLLKMQKRTLEMTGKSISTFTYPFGLLSNDSVKVLKEIGFRASLICYEQLNTIKMQDPDCLHSMGRFIRPHGKSLESILTKHGVK